MKKFLAASLLAVCLAAASQQQAGAWCNFKFGIGLNFAYSSGNNCGPCGLWHNGQVPAGWGMGMPGCDGGAPYAGMMPGYGYAAMQQPGYNYAGMMQQPGYNYAAAPAAAPYQLMSYPGAGAYYPNPNYYATGFYGY